MASSNSTVSTRTVSGSADFAAELDALHQMGLPELRTAWLRHHRGPRPRRLSRDLIIRGIAYALQERRHGGLSKSTLRHLARLRSDAARADGPRPTRSKTMKPGSKLIRDWRGVTHTVLVLENGYEWNGETFNSLSQIARAITGAHWSGPRFFGLAERSAPPTAASPGLIHAQT